jgi:hypothetical protein
MDRPNDRELRALAMAEMLMPIPLLGAFVAGFGLGVSDERDALDRKRNRPRAHRGKRTSRRAHH